MCSGPISRCAVQAFHLRFKHVRRKELYLSASCHKRYHNCQVRVTRLSRVVHPHLSYRRSSCAGNVERNGQHFAFFRAANSNAIDRKSFEPRTSWPMKLRDRVQYLHLIASSRNGSRLGERRSFPPTYCTGEGLATLLETSATDPTYMRCIYYAGVCD